MDERIEIGCCTKMSEMKGINSASEYIAEAVKRNWKAIGISDFNNTQSFIEAEEYINKNNIKNLKVLYSIKTKFIDETKNIYDIVILIKEQKGLKNLNILLSKALMNTVNGENVIPKVDLDKYRDGLLYGSLGVNGEVYQNFNDENFDKIIKYYNFIEIEPIYNNNKIEKEINKNIIKHANKNKVLVIATTNPLFIEKEDSICNEILRYSQELKDVEYDNNRYLYTTEEMLKEFNYVEGESKNIIITNTNKLAELCDNIKIEQDKVKYPIIKEYEEEIKDKCYKKVKKLYGEKLPKKIEQRLKLELDSIIKNNFEFIYLLASEIVEESEKLGYLTFARGGIGNSFVAYLLGIVDYNPIEYNLPFEIFAGINLDKKPDISLNVSSKIKEELYNYIVKKYGKDRIIACGTVSEISEKIAYDTIKKYVQDFNISIDDEKKEKLIGKLCGIKKRSGIHPGGLFIIPQDRDINEFCPIDLDTSKNILKTHLDYHKLWDAGCCLYKFDILEHDAVTELHKLEELTGINPKNIDLKDKQTLGLFLNIDNNLKGIFEFETNFMNNLISQTKPKNFLDLVYLSCLAHGTNTWLNNGEKLIKENISVDKLISNRDDIMNYLLDNGIDRKTAYEITEFVRCGKAEANTDSKEWKKYKNILEKYNIPEWYIKSAEQIKYLFPKSHAIGYVINAVRIAWYKVHYPQEFYKVYFEMNENIDIDLFYTKKEVENKLKSIYKDIEKGIYKDKNIIYDLEILLEMYEKGIRKNRKRKLDEYDLINSKAIGDYCRQIEHKFNIEELAVLIYRNQKINIDEKISQYKKLIENYPDMEVKKRIDCRHYDSTKDMIKQEITRLQTLKEVFVQGGEDIVYTFREYNKSTNEWSYSSIKKTFQEIEEQINNYIKEYDDTYSYEIHKKYLQDDDLDIVAEYKVINKKSILVNIYNNQEIDIGNIFVKIPTPFKKGDLLVSYCDTPFKSGILSTKKQAFVLNKMLTWNENIDKLLARGMYDSSDMIASGYYMCDNNEEFICELKWDYDSFEYFDGKLTGMERILQEISKLIKNEIDIEEFIKMYEKYKNEKNI